MRLAALLLLVAGCLGQAPPESCPELVRCDQDIDAWQAKASSPPTTREAETLAALIAVCRERVRTKCGAP